ncbi:MAG TPA: methyltransferase [Ktedonobacteraceae bacterium]|nr:methyltransferase [Ktedonobacteraceae bacterium]
MLHLQLLRNTLHFTRGERLLLLNSAYDPIVEDASRKGVTIVLAEDSIAAMQAASKLSGKSLQHFAFHNYVLHAPPSTMDSAVLNLLYQPNNAWMFYAVQLAYYALRPGGKLYVVGAKDRGVLSVGKRMQERFGNLETLEISKGQRVLSAQKKQVELTESDRAALLQPLQIFADNKLDEGTRLLIEALEINESDKALDLGCGAGFVGLHIARRATQGQVTMVDVSLAAVDATREAVEQSGLHNMQVLPSDGTQAVAGQQFDLVATNPPFHMGGIQTSEIAERFMRETAQILRPGGHFYLVANRFLKYEPAMQAHFSQVEEVAGNTRYKVLRAHTA